MDREVALATLTGYLGGESRPSLSPEQIGALLDRFAARDTDGLAPVDDGWTGSWRLNAAAAEGWRMKSAIVAGDYSFSADDASYSKGDVLAHCLDMEARFASMDAGTSLFSDADPTLYTVENLWV